MHIKYKKQLVVFSLSHLVIDFACFYVLMGSYSRNTLDIMSVSMGFLIYNFIAFALQPPIGYFADRTRIGHTNFAIWGCLVVVCGLVIPCFPLMKVCLCAIGNAFFHIGGGIDSLVNANGRFARSGVFISFGAIGVVLGTLAGEFNWLPMWVVITVLLVCIGLQWVLCRDKNIRTAAIFKLKNSVLKQPYLVIYISMLCIVVRAVVGTYTHIPWRSTVFLMILPVVCVFAGKLIGGILADRFGAKSVAVVSLFVSAPLLSFFTSNIFLCCVGLLFFNITTAITLCIIVSKLPNNPGFGFGLTTLALFVGTTFSFFIVMSPAIQPYLLAAFIIMSVACIWLVASNNKLQEGL